MAVTLKKLEQQTMVITGASSGIGLLLAKTAAQRGVRLVLMARDSQALERACEEIRAEGGEAYYVTGDVCRETDLRRAADVALDSFGGFDTWVNGAAVAIYGKLSEIKLEDHRRLFDTNYWGVVQGSLVALEQLRLFGGALINIGSVASDRALPLQGSYSAAKHAVKGFTDALRMEVEHDGLPVSVTLIKPGSINTPYPQHARNYLSEEPVLPPPVYQPELVVEAILHAAEHPQREIVVGGGGRLISLLGKLMPGVSDKLMEASLFRAQHSGEAPSGGDSLYSAGHDGRTHGAQPMPRRHSIYTSARLHPLAAGLGILGLMAAGVAIKEGIEHRQALRPTVARVRERLRPRRSRRQGLTAHLPGMAALALTGRGRQQPGDWIRQGGEALEGHLPRPGEWKARGEGVWHRYRRRKRVERLMHDNPMSRSARLLGDRLRH